MSLLGKAMNATQVRCNCLALRQAARRVTQFYDHALAPVGLRITQYPILAWLEADGAMTMKALAERIVMDRATLGHNIRPLEAVGLIALCVGTDRRSRHVILTDAGRERLAAARPLWRAAQARFEAAFGTDDAALLRQTLGRVSALDLLGVGEAHPGEAHPGEAIRP